ncbi:MAG: hypothetical protein ACLFNU_10790 [Bacteroidales bacterium]
MRTIVLSIALVATMLFSPFDSESQIKSFLKNKAKEVLRGDQQEEEMEQEEQEEQEEQQKKKQRGPNALERRMMQAMGLNDVKHDMNYSFSSSMLMEIETTDSEGEVQKMDYTTFFSPDSKNYALMFDAIDDKTGKKQKSTMIFDIKNGAMLMLGDDGAERSGVAMSLPADTADIAETTDVADYEDYEEYQDEEIPEEFVHPSYKSTGNTKTILGFKCKEYIYQDMESSVRLWITTDKKLNLKHAYGHMQGFGALATGGWGYGSGMVMEMIHKDIQNKGGTHMIVKDINTDKNKEIDLSGYQIVGMGGER